MRNQLLFSRRGASAAGASATDSSHPIPTERVANYKVAGIRLINNCLAPQATIRHGTPQVLSPGANAKQAQLTSLCPH